MERYAITLNPSVDYFRKGGFWMWLAENNFLLFQALSPGSGLPGVLITEELFDILVNRGAFDSAHPPLVSLGTSGWQVTAISDVSPTIGVDGFEL